MVTDAGWMLNAQLIDGGGGLGLKNARLYALRDSAGNAFGKSAGDAEGLTRRGDELWISFERDHRLERYDGALPVGLVQSRRFEKMRSNSGLEALITLPDGRFLAIAEGRRGGAVPAFVIGKDNKVTEDALAIGERHKVTGGDVGPDGRLYLVLRSYAPFVGVSIRIERFDLTGEGFPDLTKRRVLAAFEAESGIDNMEGISIWVDKAGRTRLTLIADDNFNPIQRTLVMDFEVLGVPGRR